MITHNKITPPTVELYYPDGKYLGTINEYEFLDIRVQIKNEQVSGFYFFFNNNRSIKIDKNGELEYYPKGLLDTMANLYMKLI